MNLITRFLLLIGSAVFLGMLVTATHSYMEEKKILYTATLEQETSFVHELGGLLRSNLYGTRQSMDLMAHSEMLLRAINPATRTQNEIEQTYGILNELARSSYLASAYYLLDPEGNVILQTTQAPNALRYKQPFRGIVPGATGVQGPFAIGKNEMVYTTSVPVLSRGKNLGTLICVLNFDVASRFFSASKRPVTMDFLLLTPRGKPILSKGNFFSEDYNAEHSLWVRQILSQESGTLNIEHEGQSICATFVHNPDLNISIVTFASLPAIYAPVEALLQRNLLVNGLVLLYILFATYFIMRPMMNTIKKGMDYANAIAAGNLDEDLSISRKDELGSLFSSIKLMVIRLRSLVAYAELKTRESHTTQTELRSQMVEIERFNQLGMGREERILELKHELNMQALNVGLEPPYPVIEESNAFPILDPLLLDLAQVDPELAPLLTEDATSLSTDPPARLSDLIDETFLHNFLQDFSTACHITSFLLTPDAEMIDSANWDSVCTLFHCTAEGAGVLCHGEHCRAIALCAEDDAVHFFNCRFGLHSAITPVIVKGKIIAYALVAHFLLEPPNLGFFRKQATASHFLEQSYLEAINSLPVVEKERAIAMTQILARFITINCDWALDHRQSQQKAHELHQRNIITLSLAEDAEQARREITRHKDNLEEIVRQRTFEVQNAEEKVRLILNSVPDGIIGLNTDQTIIFANPAALRMLGCDENDLLGENVTDWLQHSSESSLTEEETFQLIRSLQEKNAVHLNNQILWSKNKTNFIADIMLAPMRKSTENLGTVMIFWDITSPHELEEKIRAIYNASADIFLIFDEYLKPIDCNPAVINFFGVENEAEYLSTTERFHPPFQPDGSPSLQKRSEILASVLREGSVRVEWLMLNKDGEELPVELTLVRITLHGRPAAFACIHDLRPLKSIENTLRRERGQLQRILDTSPVGVYLVQNDLVRFLNPSCSALTTLQMDSPHKSAFVRVEDYQAIYKELNSRGFISEYALTMHSPDQSQREVMLTALNADFEGRQGELFWIVDISSMKATEKALVMAKNAAEENTAAKSEFLARISHEIRTPMNAIIGLCYLAFQSNLSQRQYSYLEKIQTAAQSLLRIINDLLDFSKVESGMMEIEQVPFKLSEVLANIKDLVGLKAEEKHIMLHFYTAPEIPLVLIGDPLRIGQVLTNICNNAVKFTEHGEISLNVHLLKREGERLELAFTIKDTGIGMTQEQIGNLFRSFAQADGSITRRYGGTGLGLVIAKALVETMGGRIWVESLPDRGSTFYFTLCVQSTAGLAAIDVGPDKQAKPDESRQHFWFGGLPILLAEDNDINQQIACEILEQTGAIVDCVENGAQAVDAVQARHYALVLMDIQMPVMDGLEASIKIRQNPEFADIPIIAMTAHAMNSDKEKSLLAGMNAHINKPLNPLIFLQTIAFWLEKSHAEPILPEPNKLPVLPMPQPDTIRELLAADSQLRPENFPTLDIVEGLGRIQHNIDLYKKLLLSFADRHGTSALAIRQHLEDTGDKLEDGNDDTQAYPLYLSHTVKGIAGNLGAHELMQAAGELERAIRSNADSATVSVLLKHYEIALETLVNSIRNTLRPNENNAIPDSHEKRIDKSSVARILTLLPNLIENDWVQAQALTEELDTLLAARCPDLMQQLARAVDDFDSHNVAEMTRLIQNAIDVDETP